MKADDGELNSVAFSVVVPVYNAQLTLSALNGRLLVVAASISSSFELIYVDDASTDDSWLVLQQLATNDPGVVVLRNEKNQGQARTTMKGIRAARGKVIATIDDDLEYAPEDLSRLYAHFGQNNLSLVYGMRRVNGLLESLIWLRNRAMDRLIGKTPSSSFKVFDRKLADHPLMRELSTFEALESGVLARSDVGWVAVNQIRRKGKSRYDIAKMISFWYRFVKEIILLKVKPKDFMI